MPISATYKIAKSIIALNKTILYPIKSNESKTFFLNEDKPFVICVNIYKTYNNMYRACLTYMKKNASKNEILLRFKKQKDK